MAGSHMAPRAPQQRHSSHSSYSSYSSSSSSSGSWKVWVLVIVLIIAIAALCFLLWQMFGNTVMDSLGLGGGSSSATADIAPGIFTQVGAESSTGKNVAGNLAVTQGTQRPDTIPPEDNDVVLLDIAWTGKNEPAEPVYVTVSDPSFPDGDGLAVHHFNGATNMWDLIGTYTIQNHSVTFLADSFSPFAFQVISATPEPTPTPEPTQEPTPTPEPTPEPTPAPIMAVDYGAYPTVQTGVYAMADELEDDAVYVLALVKDLPADAADDTAEDGDAEDETDDGEEETLPEDETDGELSFSYVDAQDATETAAAPVEGADAAVTAGPAPMATVLMNLDGTNMSTVDMPLVQAEDGTWCLAGPITEGMLWTSNRDAYKTEHRFSFSNHDSYLNLDDDDANMILNDNSTRTRFLIETATLANGSEISTINYRNDDRYYVTAMGAAAEVVTDDAFPAGTVDDTTQVSQPVYLGGAGAGTDQTLYRDVMHFTVSNDESQSLQLMAFKLDDTLAAPAGSVTTLANQITVPAIDEETNLETLVIMDGTYPLVLGVDYTISARVYNNSTVVVSIDFIGNYSGRIVRTYTGTVIRTNATPEATPTPSPSPSPTPNPGGEGTGYIPPADGGNETGGQTGTAPGGEIDDPSTATDTSATVPPYDNTDGSDT